MAESPATALRRYQTDLRKLVRGGFNRYADAKKRMRGSPTNLN